jgi:outer membrane immunogenic protein
MAKTALIAAAFCATLNASPTFAGGPVAVADEAPVAVSPVMADWSGLHFGIAASRPNGDNAWAERGAGAVSVAGDWSGTLPTLSLGYDWQRGSLVYGVTLARSGGNLTANPTTGSGFGCPGCLTTVDKLTTLSGRLGWATGKTLLFAKGGVARADAIGTATGFGTIGEGSVSGWTAGIGIERYVGAKITLSAEYSQVNLGRLELPTACGTQCYTDIDFGLVQLGVNYHW